MHALIDDQLLDRDLGLVEGGVGRRLVADLPGEDVVVVLALAVGAVGLVLDVLAEHRRVRRHRLERIDDDRQRLVFDFDQIDGVGRDIAVLGDDEGDFLVLEQHLVVGEHHLHVAGERRHVGEVDGLQRFGREHGEDAGHRGGLGRVDLLDAGVGVRRAGEVAVEHAGQLQVVDVVALALDEADVLDALALAAHALELRRRVRRRWGSCRSFCGLLERHAVELRGGELNGLDDVLIAGAAAEVAGDAEADFLLRRGWGSPAAADRRA